MMVVILTPVDGIIRWLPRGFSCSLLILSLMEKLSPLSDPLLYGSIVKTPEGKNLYMVVPMSIIARLTILFVL